MMSFWVHSVSFYQFLESFEKKNITTLHAFHLGFQMKIPIIRNISNFFKGTEIGYTSFATMQWGHACIIGSILYYAPPLHTHQVQHQMNNIGNFPLPNCQLFDSNFVYAQKGTGIWYTHLYKRNF